MVRAGPDRLVGITHIATGISLLSIPLLFFVPFPKGAALGYMVAALCCHTGYKLFLVKAYNSGGLGQVYPIARGAAPLLVALGGLGLAGEAISRNALIGLFCIVGGIASLAHLKAAARQAGGRPVLYALITSVFIAGYSVLDAMGARAAPSPHGYVVWLLAFDGLTILPFTVARRGLSVFRPQRQWIIGMGGAAMAFAAYWIVIWAMTKAPMGPVSALRETSVVFAALISALILKEGLGPRVLVAALGVAVGVVLLRV